ncbi:MAG: dTDP-4-dehydrorhamnose 3,5-epimerase [Candidatus Promineifilaceae bacterium]|nr:dTDP-4-dehydrorhamnose 3,5-epimerase [Candidatus Promineifilaceae bacterium]
MPDIHPSQLIDGVQQVHLRAFGDDRGRFLEIFRKEWFPQRNWAQVQSNHSQSAAGVLRGLHYHHHQVDYWYVFQGQIRAMLVDLRPSSPTHLATESVLLSGADDVGLFIPTGVAHGFATLSEATLMYIVDAYYDGTDEYGVAWNDPELGLDWGVDDPVVSERDRQNPTLQEIAIADLPD